MPPHGASKQGPRSRCEPTSTALEGPLHLQPELGMDQFWDGPPERDEFASRLRSMRPDWPQEDYARSAGRLQNYLPDMAQPWWQRSQVLALLGHLE